MNRAILVKSCQKNEARRAACLSTWASSMRGCNVLIATGGHEAESIYGSVSPDGGLSGYASVRTAAGDEYADNSTKLRRALSLLLSASYLSIDFVFIIDDDTFIHPDRWLAHEPAGEFECRLHHPVTDADLKRNNGRPWANGGAGWWMSRRVCELYVEKVTQRCSWDDILATAVAQDAGVPIIDRPDLYGDGRYSDSPMVAADNQLITCHPCEPAEMVKLREACRA